MVSDCVYLDTCVCCVQEHMIQNEVSILRRVKHPNIVLLIEEMDTYSELYLVMELVKVEWFDITDANTVTTCLTCFDRGSFVCPCWQGGDLFDAITSTNKYTERDASGMLYNLASAIKYLHCLNVVHRDIKPENLLVRNYIYYHVLMIVWWLLDDWLLNQKKCHDVQYNGFNII